MPRPPAAVTARAVSSTVPGRCDVDPADPPDRAVAHTVQPAAPSATAMPRPTPRLAPVTHAVLESTPARYRLFSPPAGASAGAGGRPAGPASPVRRPGRRCRSGRPADP